MSDFLITEAVDEDEKQEDDEGNFISTLSDDEFIDDDSQIDQNESDYYGFTNVMREYDDAINDSLTDFDHNQEASNYVNDGENDDDEIINDFKDFKSKVEKFKKSLFCHQGLKNDDSFFYSILYAIRYHLTKKTDAVVNDEEIKVDITEKIFDEFFPLKKFLKLNLDIFTFENQCHVVNQILNKNNLFLRIFEQKSKFRYITETKTDKKNRIREISTCVTEKYNGFSIVRIDFDKKLRQNFLPIDIIYTPVKKQDEIIDCFFTDKLWLAYRTTYNNDNKMNLKHTCAFRCHYCPKFFSRKERLEKHLENCNGKPGFIYNFETQNLLTFEENLKLKYDIPLTAYIDLETTAPTDTMLDPESCKMQVVSYAIIFAFHPKLEMKRIIIERSFGHSLEKLTTIDHLTSDQFKFIDSITLKQLRDRAISVSEKKKCTAVSEMFSTELKFASDCLLKWFYSKNKKKELSLDEKREYEVSNPIDWEKGKCEICTFPLHINPSDKVNNSEEKMSFGDFIIQKEHKSLRNIFLEEDLKKSDAIKDIESYHENFLKYLKLCF